MRFPDMVYRSPGINIGPPVDGKSTSFDTLGVDHADALAAALDAGWCETLAEAVGLVAKAESDAPPAVDVVDLDTVKAPDVPALEGFDSLETERSVVEATDEFRPSRDDLEKQAKELGLTFGNRISDANLQQRIDHALSLTEKKGD